MGEFDGEGYGATIGAPGPMAAAQQRHMMEGANGCDAAAREKFIPAELKMQAIAVTHLDKLVEELTKRLDPVMDAQKEITGTGPAEGNQAKDNRPELARILGANTRQLNSTATKIERILRRLEI